MNIKTVIEIRDGEGMPLSGKVTVQIYAHANGRNTSRKLTELATDESSNCEVDLRLRKGEKAFIVLGDATRVPLWQSRDFSSYTQEIRPANFFGFRRTRQEAEIKDKFLETGVIHTSPNKMRFLIPDAVVYIIEAPRYPAPSPLSLARNCK